MTDPDLIERVAQASFQGGWHAAHPDVRADWRGAVAAIIGAYEADRDRPWPRFAEGGFVPTIGKPSDTIPVPLPNGCTYYALNTPRTRPAVSRIEPVGPGPAVRLTPGILRLPGYMDMLIDAPIHLALEVAHPVTPRIDTIYASGSGLAVATGRPSFVAVPPAWPIGSHFVANVLVRAGAMTIYPDDIHTDPSEAFTGHARVDHPTQRDLDKMTGQP